MCYREGTAHQTTLLSGFLKLKGTPVKITRPLSGGPFAPRKAHEGTVSQGDQELGLRHHGSRYPDNARLGARLLNALILYAGLKLQKFPNTCRVSHKDIHPGKRDTEWSGGQGSGRAAASASPHPPSPLCD